MEWVWDSWMIKTNRLQSSQIMIFSPVFQWEIPTIPKFDKPGRGWPIIAYMTNGPLLIVAPTRWATDNPYEEGLFHSNFPWRFSAIFCKAPWRKTPFRTGFLGPTELYINSRKPSNSFWCEPLKKAPRSAWWWTVWGQLVNIFAANPWFQGVHVGLKHMKFDHFCSRQFLSYLWYRSWYTWHGT